jgi:hypothetical protein
MRPSTIRAALAAILAATALSAVAASGAQAENVNHNFVSASPAERTTLTGVAENQHVITIKGGSLSTSCESTAFDGTVIGGEVDELTLVPTYDDCQTSLGAAEWIENHCAYVFDTDTTTHGADEVHAPMDIECASENTMEIKVPSVGITMTIGPQNDLHGVRFDNVEDPETGKDAITLDTTVSGIAWTCAPAFLCGLGGIGTSGTDGTYDGSVIITGFEDDGEDPGETGRTTPNLVHGDPVDVFMTT